MASSSSSSSSDPKYEFNAPKQFDFTACLDPEDQARNNKDEEDDPEKYFDFDHENNVPLVPSVQVSSPTSCSSSVPVPVSIKKVMQKEDTPSRRRLREAVKETVEIASNSPQPSLPPSRRSGVPAPAPAPAPASSLSPAQTRWRKLQKATPEILRKARKFALEKAGGGSQTASTSCSNSSSLATSQRLAHQGTASSTARSNEKKSTESKVPAPQSTSHAAAPLKPTHPQPFKFSTQTRSQQHGGGGAGGALKAAPSGQVDFSKMLRSYKEKASKGSTESLRVTQPKPFKLSVSNQRRRSRSCEPSPGRRGLTSRRGRSPSPMKRRREAGPDDEVPQAKLSRQQQHGGSTCSNSSSGGLGGGASSSRSSANAKPFSFVEKELEKVKEKYAAAAKEKHGDFIHNLRGYQATGTSHKHGVTQAEPFKFSVVNRPRRANSAEPASDPLEASVSNNHIIKAKPMPHYGVPVIMTSQQKKTTEMAPFSFDERNQQMMTKKQEKIEKIYEEEKKAREFKASQMPDLNKPVGLPIKEVLLPTKPQPFHHQVEKRVEARVTKWQESLEMELKAQREAALFKARDPHVLNKEPFIPKASEKPLSEIDNFELHSDRRAAEREQYERMKKQKEAELEGMKRQMEERRRQEEEEQVRQQRSEAIHKAQPIKKYAPIEIHGSSKPITVPVSPKFSKLSRHKE